MYSSGELLEECLDLVLYTDVRYNTNNKEVKKNIIEILTKTVDRNRPQKSKKSPKKENSNAIPPRKDRRNSTFCSREERGDSIQEERERERLLLSCSRCC